MLYNMKILIIEDDKSIVRMLVAYLRKQDYDTDVAFDGKMGCEMALKEEFDLIILDLGLPDIDGWDVCDKVRKKKDIPILILTARDDLKDKVRGLDTGADDYLTKPFEMKELKARISALSRRNSRLLIRGNILRAGGILMNIKDHIVKVDNGEVELTKKEYALLEYFLRNKNQILSRLQILTHVWDQNVDTFTNTVDVHVASLRKKISNNGDIIRTVHGVGYMLKDEKEEIS